MSYADITFSDKNFIKRWLQQQRLKTAVRLGGRALQKQEAICDFGAGNGELCKKLSKHHPNAQLVCYEPTPELLEEAVQNLDHIPDIKFCRNVEVIPRGTLDIVYCLEVFEHLPQKETGEALQAISDLLKPHGVIVVGVPIELGFASIYKGLFRMIRKQTEYETDVKHLISSFFGRPPTNRPSGEIAPGFRFHFEHMGFDHRHLKKLIMNTFQLQEVATCPFKTLGPWLMPEIYFVATKTKLSFTENLGD